MDFVLIAIGVIMGLLGGLAHQLHDSEIPNNASYIARGCALGIIAGLLTALTVPPMPTNIFAVTTFIAGWFGDSVILNIIRRYSR